MSIDIIHPGALPGDKRIERSCRRCGCRISFQERDTILVPDNLDGGSRVIACPTCLHDIAMAADVFHPSYQYRPAQPDTVNPRPRDMSVFRIRGAFAP